MNADENPNSEFEQPPAGERPSGPGSGPAPGGYGPGGYGPGGYGPGAAAGPSIGPSIWRVPIQRSRHDRMIAGVAGGIGEHFGVDPTIVRLALVGFTLFGGAGLGIYAVAWLLLPDEGETESIAEHALGQRRAA